MGGGTPFVLVGFDGSPDSSEALRLGIALASYRVLALSVLRPPSHFEPTQDDGDEAAAICALAERHFDQARMSHQSDGLQMSAKAVVSISDKIAIVLDEYASAHGFGMLVLGRHGEGVLPRKRLGQVADLAARASSVPVLLVSAT